MKLLKYYVLVIFIVTLVFTCIESKGGRGGFRSGGFRSSSRSTSRSGGWFSSSSSRRSSSSVATSRPHASYGNSYYGSRRSSSSVVTGRPRPRNYASKVTTPRTYVQTPRSYVQGTSGSTYYGGYYTRNRYGNRRNNTVPYSPGYYNNNFYGQRSSMGNPLLTGLGGSVLGMYLGYQLGSMSTNMALGNSYPRYAVVHHYHHGDQPIAKNITIDNNISTTCRNISFCLPKTQPLCLLNGTVYCITSTNEVNSCNVNSTNLQCVNTTLTAPCLNETTHNCTDESLTNITTQIPCLTNIFISGILSAEKLQVHENVESLFDTNTATYSTQSKKHSGNEFCVTVIAEPLPPAKNLSNGEYIEQIQYDQESRDELFSKFETILDNLLH